MKMRIGDDYYQGIYFEQDEDHGTYDVPDDIAYKWLEAEKDFHKAQDEASQYI